MAITLAGCLHLSTTQPVIPKQKTPLSRYNWKSVTILLRVIAQNQSKQGARSVVHPYNQAIRQAMPAASFNGEVKERTNSLRYPGTDFHRMPTYKKPIDSAKLRYEKGLPTLKAMAVPAASGYATQSH